MLLSDCIFTPSDSDEEYVDAWFDWDDDSDDVQTCED